MTKLTTCAFLEGPDGLEPRGPEWDRFSGAVRNAKPGILIMNELPFGPWLASGSEYDGSQARTSIALHETGTEALRALGVPAIISSRPVAHGKRLANEAFVIEGSSIRVLHRKQYFPDEPGWFEANWFSADHSGFGVQEIAGLKVGVLLCTELMFNEHARHYGRDGADLIVVPRATGGAHSRWLAAGAMAAIASGSYVISSNRVGSGTGGPAFAGRGFAFAPNGDFLSETSPSSTLVMEDVNTAISLRQKFEYPCYVREQI